MRVTASNDASEFAPQTLFSMPRYNAPFEIHVHGQVPLRADVKFEQLQDALKPMWKYAGARSLSDGASSSYEDEPGIKFDANEHLLQIAGRLRVTMIFARPWMKSA